MEIKRKYHNVKQGSDEWLKLRLGKFTGSDFDTFLGAKSNKGYKSGIIKKASEIILKERSDSDNFSNFHMQRGNELEEEAISIYELINNCTVKAIGFIEIDEFTGCSIDGEVSEEGMIEVKCKDNHTFLEQIIEGKDGIEKKYKTQMQYNMYVAGKKWCDYICYNPKFPNSIATVRIKRDKKIIATIKERLKECIQEVKEILKTEKKLRGHLEYKL